MFETHIGTAADVLQGRRKRHGDVECKDLLQGLQPLWVARVDRDAATGAAAQGRARQPVRGRRHLIEQRAVQHGAAGFGQAHPDRADTFTDPGGLGLRRDDAHPALRRRSDISEQVALSDEAFPGLDLPAVDFDAGLDGLPFDVDATGGVEFGWGFELDFGFGLDKYQGVYVAVNNNTHYEQLEADNHNLKDVLVRRTQSEFNGLPSNAAAGVITGIGFLGAGTIVNMAEEGGWGTIVLGRKGWSSVSDFFMGRVSNKIIHLAKELAVWVVS